jgi:hypothetical protein
MPAMFLACMTYRGHGGVPLSRSYINRDCLSFVARMQSGIYEIRVGWIMLFYPPLRIGGWIERHPPYVLHEALGMTQVQAKRLAQNSLDARLV